MTLASGVPRGAPLCVAVDDDSCRDREVRVGYWMENMTVFEMWATPEGAMASRVTKAEWMRIPFRAGIEGMWILALAGTSA
jgi:hypothetical protein